MVTYILINFIIIFFNYTKEKKLNNNYKYNVMINEINKIMYKINIQNKITCNCENILIIKLLSICPTK